MAKLNYKLKSGDVFGPYEIVRPIAKGGMGEVYEAMESNIQRRIALKIVNNNSLDDDEVIQRFFSEAKLLGKIQHPNIVSIYSMGEVDSIHYIAMEYIDGVSLDVPLKNMALPLTLSLEIVRQLIMGIMSMHNQNIIHRDIKPQNIILQKNLKIKIVDLGIAKSLESQTQYHTVGSGFMGTPKWLAPELLLGLPATKMSDIWNIGLITYNLLTGIHPFFAGDKTTDLNGTGLEKFIINEEDYDLNIFTPKLVKVINKMLSLKLESRYERLEEVAQDLEPISRYLEASKEEWETLFSKPKKSDVMDKYLTAQGHEGAELKLIKFWSNYHCYNSNNNTPVDFSPFIYQKAVRSLTPRTSHKIENYLNKIPKETLTQSFYFIIFMVLFGAAFQFGIKKYIMKTSNSKTDTASIQSTNLKNTKAQLIIDQQYLKLQLSAPVTDVTARVTNPPIFQWERIPQASYYRLQVSNDKDFKTIIVERSVRATTWTWHDILPGNYYWRVKAMGHSGSTQGQFSDTGLLFVTVPEPIGLKDVTVPKGTARARFRWDTSRFASFYKLQIRDAQGFIKKEFITSNNYLETPAPSNWKFYSIQYLNAFKQDASLISKPHSIKFESRNDVRFPATN